MYRTFGLLLIFCTMNSATVNIMSPISLCICAHIPVEHISRPKVAGSKDMCNLNLWIFAKFFSKEAAAAIRTSTYSLFAGCGFLNQRCWGPFKRTAYNEVLISKYTKLWPLYRCTKLTQCSLTCCQLSICTFHLPQSLDENFSQGWRHVVAYSPGKIVVSIWWNRLV